MTKIKFYEKTLRSIVPAYLLPRLPRKSDDSKKKLYHQLMREMYLSLCYMQLSEEIVHKRILQLFVTQYGNAIRSVEFRGMFTGELRAMFLN